LAFFGLLSKSTLLPVSMTQSDENYICGKDITQLTLVSFQMTFFGQKVLNLPFVSCNNPILCHVRKMICHLGRSSLPGDSPVCNYIISDREVSFMHKVFGDRV
jgi:hypothetical protein